MAKKLSYVEHFLDTVQRKHDQPPTEAQLERILARMHSPEEAERAQAVRRLCPCRTPWPIYQRYLDEIQKLQKDENPQVRAAALHLAEDADRLERREERRERAQERASDQQARQRRERSLRRKGSGQG